MKGLGIFLAIVVAAVLMYKSVYPSVTVRYRISVVANLNGKEASGSSIIDVTYYKNVQLLGASHAMQIGVNGEATSIDFGDRRLLVVLLAPGAHGRSAPESIIPFVFGLTKGGIGPSDFPQVAKLSGSRVLPPELFPATIFFRDSLDPTSVELVNPPSVVASSAVVPKLLSIKLEILDRGIWPFNYIMAAGRSASPSIDHVLPWLKDSSARKQFSLQLMAEKFPASSSRETYSLFRTDD